MNSKVKKTLAYMLCFSMIVSAGMTGVHSEEAPAEEDTSAADSADETEEEEDDAEEEETPRTEEEAMALMTEVASNSNLKLTRMRTREPSLSRTLKQVRSGGQTP